MDCAAFCTAFLWSVCGVPTVICQPRRPFEMFVDELKVVVAGDDLRVAHAGTDDVRRPGLGPFGLARGPEVLEELRPWLDAGLRQDALELGPQIYG